MSRGVMRRHTPATSSSSMGTRRGIPGVQGSSSTCSTALRVTSITACAGTRSTCRCSGPDRMQRCAPEVAASEARCRSSDSSATGVEGDAVPDSECESLEATVHAAGTTTFHERRHYAFVRELALAAAALTYFGVRNLTAGAAAEAMSNADRLARLERRAHIAWERSLQDALLDHDLLVTLANWVYIWGHWPVIITAAIVLYRKRHDRYLLLRNTIFVSGAIGFLFFALLPVAPPRLADPSLMDTVTLHSDAYRALQPPGLTNQYAAFPSLHFGWNLVVGIAVWGATRTCRCGCSRSSGRPRWARRSC